MKGNKKYISEIIISKLPVGSFYRLLQYEYDIFKISPCNMKNIRLDIDDLKRHLSKAQIEFLLKDLDYLHKNTNIIEGFRLENNNLSILLRNIPVLEQEHAKSRLWMI